MKWCGECTRGAANENMVAQKEKEFKTSKKILKVTITRANKWREVVESIQGDVWGTDYKLVMKRL